MCVSKGLTGGYLPMAITITTQKVFDAFYADYREGKAFMHSHTYSGNPLGCAAALAVQKILREDNILPNAQARAPYLTRILTDRLGDLPYVGEIRHLGLIHAIELVQDQASKKPFDPGLRVGYQIYQFALKRGLLLRPLGDVLYFNPPLTISEPEMELAVQRCADAIHDFFIS